MRSAMSAGGLLDQALEREHPVLARQRQVRGPDEHRGVLAEGPHHPLHRDEGAERVAVGVLVCGKHEALVVADAIEHQLAQLLPRWATVHGSPISSISSSTRIARSVVSS